MIKIGNLDIDKFYLGDSSDVKIYIGNVKVWPEDVLKYKLVAKYGDVTEYTVTCDGSGELTQSEVNGLGSITAMTDAVIDACSSDSFKVGEKAFSGATSLTSVTINEGVTELGGASFQGTSNLRNITFPSTLKVLGGTAFRKSGIREISGIPTGVTYLGSGVFADMTSLTAATIPSSVTGSSNNVFLRDTALKEVHFEGRTAPALGADAFTNCTALTKIVIPDCDCYNSYAAQSQFSGKTNIIYGEDGVKCKKESYPYAFKRVSRGGSAYTVACNSTSSNTISSGNTTKGLSNAQISGKTQTQTPVSVVFGDCCTTINGKACYNWTYLTSVTISDNVTTLNENSIFENTPDSVNASEICFLIISSCIDLYFNCDVASPVLDSESVPENKTFDLLSIIVIPLTVSLPISVATNLAIAYALSSSISSFKSRVIAAVPSLSLERIVPSFSGRVISTVADLTYLRLLSLSSNLSSRYF